MADFGKQFSTGKVAYAQFKDLISKRPQPTDNEDKIKVLYRSIVNQNWLILRFSKQKKEAFKIFDKSGTGQIEIVELRHVLTTLGEKLSPADVKKKKIFFSIINFVMIPFFCFVGK